jgi:hypothetical protein
MSDGSILEVSHETDAASPCELNHCPGDYGYGKYSSEAYKEAWAKMSEDTTNAIKNKAATFIMEHMNVEEGVVQEQMGVMNITVSERETMVASFPGVKGLEDMVLELDDYDFNAVVTEKDTDRLLEMVQQDYYDPFCGDNGMFNPKEMFKFLENNDIDISDTVLIQELNFEINSMAVVFIEPDDFKEFTDIELSKASQRDKDWLMNDTVQALSTWNDGQVYRWDLYDKDGDIIDGCGGYYGENEINEAVKDFKDGYDIEAVKDLGKHDDIANCLYANRKELVKSGEER